MTDLTSHTDKLLALRNKLEVEGLDGFLVPLTDEYQGEYVPEYAQRLAWITGFTGSAGLAIILKDKAVVFVDGRYTLQVANEVDAALFEFNSLVLDEEGRWPPAVWLEENLKLSGRLGFDPWLHTEDEVQRFERVCKGLEGAFVSVQKNLIDEVWLDQPDRPLSPVAVYPEKFAGLSSAQKRAEVATELVEKNIDAAVLTGPDSLAWLLNIRGGDVPFTPLPLGFAIVHKTGKVDLFMEGRKIGEDVIAHLGADIALWQPEKLGEVIDKLCEGPSKISISKTTTPYWVGARIKSNGGGIVYGDDPCTRPKACKNETEISGIKAAHVRDGVAMVRFLSWLEEATKTKEIDEIAAADKLEEFRCQNDHFQGLSFPTISGAGANGAIVHYRVDARSNSPLKKGSLYLVDSGGQYLDGTTDITRTIAIGTPTSEMKDRFTRVLKGHIALSSAVFPAGTCGSQLDGLARGALWAAGLDYDHGTGHGVGCYLGVHEGPHRISKLPNKVALEAGMVLSNEPGYYKTGEYGIRIENLVVVAPAEEIKGSEKQMFIFEPLTLAPLDTNLIDLSLLTSEEIKWFDSYHAEVWRRLAPLVLGQDKAWLKKATEPLGIKNKAD